MDDKYNRLKNLKKQVEKTDGFYMSSNGKLVDDFLKSDVDEKLIEELDIALTKELDLEITEEEILAELELVKKEFTDKNGKGPSNDELLRELAAQAIRIDDITDYAELLWDSRANVCTERTGFLAKQYAKTMFGRLRRFDINQLQAGEGPGIICVNGFLTEGCGGRDWLDEIHKSKYKNNPIYLIEWEASSLKKIFADAALSVSGLSAAITATTIGSVAGAGVGVVTGAVAGAGVGGIAGGGIGGGIGSAVGGVAGIALSPLKYWYRAMLKAEKVADMLSYILQCTNNDHGFILMGHSLGARIIYYTLKSLQVGHKVKINDIYLLGGAVANTEWDQFHKLIDGTIYNCLSDKDDILKCLYQSCSLFSSSPIGVYSIDNAKSIHNIDAFNVAGVDGHCRYKGKEGKGNFSKILNFLHSK